MKKKFIAIALAAFAVIGTSVYAYTQKSSTPIPGPKDDMPHMGMRCIFCKGTGFDGNFNCGACKGTGRDRSY